MKNEYMEMPSLYNSQNHMEDTIKHTLLCLLEELNDILHEGRLGSEKDLDQIVYQCKRIIDITEE